MNNNLFVKILACLGIYLGLTYFGGQYGRIALYPIRMLVTFLHEFGHAFGAVITGGMVDDLQINSDGSGFTVTRGGWRSIIIMGGYIGSAIFGNLLFFIGTLNEESKVPKITTYILAGIMIFSGIFWFNSFFTTGLLMAFALFLFFIASKTNLDSPILLFFGLASILHIIQDFNVGPSSDLEMYAEHFVIVPATVWMYIWLAVVVLLFIWNIRLIYRKSQMV